MLGIGRWLGVNGEAIYDTHNWTKFSEVGSDGLKIHFTVKGDALYAIVLGKWPGSSVLITSLADGQSSIGKITSITMLGSKGQLSFNQDAKGLKVILPATAPCNYAYTLKINGLKTNPPTWTESGDPMVNNGVPASVN